MEQLDIDAKIRRSIIGYRAFGPWSKRRMSEKQSAPQNGGVQPNQGILMDHDPIHVRIGTVKMRKASLSRILSAAAVLASPVNKAYIFFL